MTHSVKKLNTQIAEPYFRLLVPTWKIGCHTHAFNPNIGEAEAKGFLELGEKINQEEFVKSMFGEIS